MDKIFFIQQELFYDFRKNAPTRFPTGKLLFSLYHMCLNHRHYFEAF